MTKYFDSEDPKNWVQVPLLDNVGIHFDPRNGAAVDLEGLVAVAQSSNRVLFTYLHSRFPQLDQIILYGLNIQGKNMSKGPPGIIRANGNDLRISAGAAIIRDAQQNFHVVNIEEEIRLLEGVDEAQDKMLVLSLEKDEEESIDVEPRAYATFYEKFQFLSVDEAKSTACIPLAKGFGQDYWFTDLARVWQPDHAGIQQLHSYFDKLENVVWDADRHGDAFLKYQLLGADWKLYQAKASGAITAARFILSGRSSNTQERIRTLRNLYWQLLLSVSDAAHMLGTLLGKEESNIIGSYGEVIQPYPDGWL